ncbi:DUF4233 domain-containing protein [Brachybacterium hainanense]|uniref:DUF4233 domain-containing protein n=1 Tax=Brachybacterium hainanense TaxID=1541174 RepID=A0ABV6RF01_9MICO
MRTVRDLTPSPRAHGAQRMLSSTTLTIEALVVFFALLVAHQLSPEHRLMTWAFGLATAVGLLLVSGMLKRGSWPYYAGMALQVPILLLGILVPAMWVIGLVFGGLFVFGVYKGHQLDAEKDEVDRRYRAAHPEEAQGGEDR